MNNLLPYTQKLFITLLLSTLFISLANAAPQILSAPDAQAAVTAGRMLLLDIRSAEEWQEDGVAEGAFPVSMHDDSFGKHLNRILAQRGDKTLGLICATGGRTATVISVLDKHGVTGLVDVSEGMHGNHRGPGWLARGLPVVRVDQALQHFANVIK